MRGSQLGPRASAKPGTGGRPSQRPASRPRPGGPRGSGGEEGAARAGPVPASTPGGAPDLGAPSGRLPAPRHRLPRVCHVYTPLSDSCFPARVLGAGGSASLRPPPPRPGRRGGCGAGRFSRHKRGVRPGRRRGSHGNAAPRGSRRVPAAGGCAANGALRCGRRGSQPLLTPGLPHLHLRLRGLGASPPASAPELLTEGRGICRRTACSRWSCAPPRILLHPVGTLPLAPRPRGGGTRHCSTVVQGPSEPLRGLVSTDTNKRRGRLPVYEKGYRQDLIMMIMDYSIKAYLTKRQSWHWKRVFFPHLSLCPQSHLRRKRFCQARNDFFYLSI